MLALGLLFRTLLSESPGHFWLGHYDRDAGPANQEKWNSWPQLEALGGRRDQLDAAARGLQNPASLGPGYLRWAEKTKI